MRRERVPGGVGHLEEHRLLLRRHALESAECVTVVADAAAKLGVVHPVDLGLERLDLRERTIERRLLLVEPLDV